MRKRKNAVQTMGTPYEQPRKVRTFLSFTPLQIDVIKFLAVVLMVTDHACRSLGFNDEALLLLGRGAFPLFGLIWGYNLAHSRAVTQEQATRLWIWALVAQPFFWLALYERGIRWETGNILFAFAVMTQAVVLWKMRVGKGFTVNYKALAIMLVGAWCELFSAASYGWAGVVMLLMSYLLFAQDVTAKTRGSAMLVWPFAVFIMNQAMGWMGMLAGLFISLAVLITSLPLYQPHDPASQKRLFPRGFFVEFYVAHLAVLGLIVLFRQ